MHVNQNLQIIISPHSTNISPCVVHDCFSGKKYDSSQHKLENKELHII